MTSERWDEIHGTIINDTYHGYKGVIHKWCNLAGMNKKLYVIDSWTNLGGVEKSMKRYNVIYDRPHKEIYLSQYNNSKYSKKSDNDKKRHAGAFSWAPRSFLASLLRRFSANLFFWRIMWIHFQNTTSTVADFDYHQHKHFNYFSFQLIFLSSGDVFDYVCNVRSRVSLKGRFNVCTTLA